MPSRPSAATPRASAPAPQEVPPTASGRGVRSAASGAPQPPSRFERTLRGAALGFAGVALLAVVWTASASGPGMLVWFEPAAPWLMAPREVDAGLQQYGRLEPPTTRFVADFELPDELAAGALTVQARAFGEWTLAIDGRTLALSADAPGWKHWRRATLDVPLAAGPHRIEARVANLHGPALFAFRLESSEAVPGGRVVVSTAASWLAAIDDAPLAPALYASDRWPLRDVASGELAARELAKRAPWLALFAIVSLALSLYAQRSHRLSPRLSDPGHWLLAIALLWIVLFAAKFAGLKPAYGFDAAAHQEYLAYLGQSGWLPRADEGWAMYHPPLFYWLSWLGVRGLGVIGVAPTLAVKVLPFACGIGLAALSLRLTQRLRPGEPWAAILAAGFAAFLPANLVTAAYVSNEALHALLAAAGLVVAVSSLRDERATAKRLAAVSILFGLALLTKFTALVVAVPCLLALGLRVACDTRGAQEAAASRGRALAALCLPVVGICGWFYLRNALVFGSPLVGNWSLDAPGQAWWSPPGFHTPAYFLHFGSSLKQPYLSGFVSFWDALYSTTWGDGLLGGQTFVGTRHGQWHYGFMAAGMLLALPATAAVIAGAVRSARGAVHDADPRRRAALALTSCIPSVLLLALLCANLTLPYYGQARAVYALAATPAAAWFFCDAVCALDAALARRGHTLARAILVAYLGSLFGGLYLGFAA